MAREAARHVDVILAGFGFDGLFAGLPRHRLVDLANKVPLARGPLEQFYDFTFRSVEPTTAAGRVLKYAYFRGTDYPAPRVLAASSRPPTACRRSFSRPRRSRTRACMSASKSSCRALPRAFA